MKNPIANLASGVLPKHIPDLYDKWEAESQRFFQEYAEDPAGGDIVITDLSKSKAQSGIRTICVYFESKTGKEFSGKKMLYKTFLPGSRFHPSRMEESQPGAVLHPETQAQVFLEQKEIEDLRMRCERLRTNLMEVRFEQIQAKNRAEQADDRAGKLLDLANKLEAANKDIQKALDARRIGKPCLHDKYEGYVARRLDEHLVAIEFETSDGRVVEQVHHRDQFVDGKLPQEGDRMEAHVLAWFHPPEPADVSQYLTPEEVEHGFPGFQKAIEQRRKEEQAEQT